MEFFSVDPGTIGGILLILGAYFLWRGNLVYSVGTYFVADIMWVVLSVQAHDMLGATLVSIGMFFGLLVFIKTQQGSFVKELHANTNHKKNNTD